jgi:hypothetical protein
MSRFRASSQSWFGGDARTCTKTKARGRSESSDATVMVAVVIVARDCVEK